ncbi:hypothetical protein JHK86_006859 [Glycine max]|nr:hypothetical protein JHK86_006859 [Glycine max]
MKTKARNRIIDNIVSETKQEAPYQDDELVGLQEVLELDPNVINESLADVDGGGEQIDADLLKKLDLVEPNEDECMLSENDIESDFDDTDTSMVIHTLKLIACIMFQPTCGYSNIISNIISAKFDELAASWLMMSVDLRNRCFGEFKKEYRWHPQEERAIRAIFETKGSRILKNAMNKIRNGQDKGKWITANVRAALDEHWGSTDFLNKSSTAKANRSVDRGASAYCEEGTSTKGSPNIANSVNDNEIYLNVVGGPNYKGNMYGLGTLSISLSATIIDGIEHHVNDAQVDRPHDMGNDH